jgi:sialic acid synthase SpsE
MAMRTLVIAEPGCTAEGDFDRMVRSVDAAADAGADAFKAQWVSDVERMVQRRHAPEYRQAYRWLNFPVAWHARLREVCATRGLEYGCTSYLPEDVATVNHFVDFHKISSFEAMDRGLIGAAVNTRKRVFVSTGMQDDTFFDYCWGLHATIELLHCTSNYPTPLDSINLAAMAPPFGPLRGLSDHSRHVLTGAVAVGAGARVIEAHLRLEDTDRNNPDYAVAFSPKEFAEYVRNIRLAEALMGSSVKQVQPCEEPMLRYRVTA